MASLLGLDTKLDIRPSLFRRDSAQLCDQFWKAVHLDFGDFDDDLSICCNDDYAFFGERSLDALDRIRNLAEPKGSTMCVDGTPCLPRSPSTPLSYGSTRYGSRAATPGHQTPIEASTELEKALWAGMDIIQRPSRPELSKHLPSPPTLRIATPAASLMAMASSFLDRVLQLAGPPPATKDTRELLNQEYDVSILESDVLVQVIEGARWAGLWDPGPNSDSQSSDGHSSPIVPMSDTPTLDITLYNQRMTHWMLGPRADTPALSPEIDLD